MIGHGVEAMSTCFGKTGNVVVHARRMQKGQEQLHLERHTVTSFFSQWPVTSLTI